MPGYLEPLRGGLARQPRQSRRVLRATTHLEEETAVRLRWTQATTAVQQAKVIGLAQTAREASVRHSLLHRHALVAASGDPMLFDALSTYTSLYQVGAAEIMADLVDSYCDESRRH